MRSLIRTLPVACLFFLITSLLYAQPVPATLSYQGRLTDPAGSPINGVVGMEFRIFGSATGPDLLWNEAWAALPVINGLFSVMLGSNTTPLTPDVFGDGADRYLEIVVDGGVLTPRQRIGSVGYAARAALSDDSKNLGGHPAADYARLNAAQTFTAAVQLISASNMITGTFMGNGAGLGNLDAGNLTTGVLPSGRLAGSYPQPVGFPNPSNSFTGDGSGLSRVDAARLGGAPPDMFLNAYNRATGPGCKLSGSSLVCGGSVCVPDVNVSTSPIFCGSAPPACQPFCFDLGSPSASVSLPPRGFTRPGEYDVRTIESLLRCRPPTSAGATVTLELFSGALGRDFDAITLTLVSTTTPTYQVVNHRSLTGERLPVGSGDSEILSVVGRISTSTGNPQCWVMAPIVDETLIGFGGTF